MTVFRVTSPLPYYFDEDGAALDSGYLWFGVKDLDPKTNPIPVYWDEAKTIIADQPIRTLNGVPVRNGDSSNIFTEGEFSETVENKNNVLIRYNPKGVAFSAETIKELYQSNDNVLGAVDFTDVAELRAYGEPEHLRSARVLGGFGSGFYCWDENSILPETPFGGHPGAVIKPDGVIGAGRWIFKIDETIIKIADQSGATNEEKYNNALNIAQESQEVWGEYGLDVDLTSQPSDIKSGIKVKYQGTKINVINSVDRPINIETGARRIVIDGLDIDCMGNNTIAAISSEAPQGLEINNPKIKNFSARAIDIYSGDEPARDIFLNYPELKTPASGVGFPIAIRSGIGGHRVENAHVRGLRGWGINPDNATNPNVHFEDFTATNEFTADFTVLQGVNGGSLIDCDSKFSGSAGTSISRCSSNIVVKNNNFEMCFEPGINTGSGLVLLHVDNIANFYSILTADFNNTTQITTSIRPSTGDTILMPAVNAGANSNRISAVVPDESGSGGWLWIESTFGSNSQAGDVVSQIGGGTGTITPAPMGSREAGLSVITSDNITVIDNTLIDTAIQRQDGDNLAGINGIRTLGWSVVHGNTVSNPAGIGRANAVLSNSGGTVGYGRNYFNGEVADPDKYILANVTGGARWLYTDGAEKRTNLIGSGKTLLNGNAEFINGMTVERISEGQYRYTLVEDFESDEYVVMVQLPSPSIQSTVTINSSTEFIVRIRPIDPADGNFMDQSHTVLVAG